MLLVLESTCDETAAALIDERLNVRGSSVATQDELHQVFGGVVPEIASRAHVERILPVIDQCLKRAGATLADVSAVAVANTPGLAGSLLVGISAAKALCVALDVPLVAVNHIHAHVYACRVAAGVDVFPCVGYVVSGGHTTLFYCESPLKFHVLGGTLDDAAGEAFDKTASLLGLPYPGGPHIEKAAAGGDPRVYRFPRTFLNEDRIEFSFSGLKTAVRYAIAPQGTELVAPPAGSKLLADLAASFQQAVIDVLIGKAEQALRATGYKTLCVGGGVAANGAFRKQLEARMTKLGVTLHIAPRELCTDNAVMGAIAWERLRAGLVESLELDAVPGLVR
ncbi:MAG: tRNA (adenosine(37)-N6)-threonylcarbamoyltransferase complex transferase subunit TsaD [Planctomycetes bacterium]|nr:tRNA (adenosine(37)-N6)-threonylcarbamoyltransferase complex transferase subunit TsaD [Planctomycetota bacterium]